MHCHVAHVAQLAGAFLLPQLACEKALIDVAQLVLLFHLNGPPGAIAGEDDGLTHANYSASIYTQLVIRIATGKGEHSSWVPS